MKCDSRRLDSFFDGELDSEEHARVSRHIEDCPSCQRELRGNKAISTHFKADLDEQLSRINFNNLEQGVLELIKGRSVSWWMRLKELLKSKTFLVPVTAAATILVLFFSFTRHPASVSSPSAIIESFAGEVSSVMILETPKSHQTIIWFNEEI